MAEKKKKVTKKKTRENMFDAYMKRVFGDDLPPMDYSTSANPVIRFIDDSLGVKKSMARRGENWETVPGIGDVAMYDLTQIQYPKHVQSQKKARKKHEKAPTGRERTRATLAKVKPLPADIKKRKGGGQVSPGEAYVASFYKELK